MTIPNDQWRKLTIGDDHSRWLMTMPDRWRSRTTNVDYWRSLTIIVAKKKVSNIPTIWFGLFAFFLFSSWYQDSLSSVTVKSSTNSLSMFFCVLSSFNVPFLHVSNGPNRPAKKTKLQMCLTHKVTDHSSKRMLIKLQSSSFHQWKRRGISLRSENQNITQVLCD